jgi:hypothetical protein
MEDFARPAIGVVGVDHSDFPGFIDIIANEDVTCWGDVE